MGNSTTFKFSKHSIFPSFEQNADRLFSAAKEMGVQITSQQAKELSARASGYSGGWEQMRAYANPEQSVDLTDIAKRDIMHLDDDFEEGNYLERETMEVDSIRLESGASILVSRGSNGLPEDVTVVNTAGLEFMNWSSEEVEEDPLSVVGAIFGLANLTQGAAPGKTPLSNKKDAAVLEKYDHLPILSAGNVLSKRQAKKTFNKENGTIEFLFEVDFFSLDTEYVESLTEAINEAVDEINLDVLAEFEDEDETSFTLTDIEYKVAGFNAENNATILYVHGYINTY